MKRAPMMLLIEDDPNDVFMATLAFEATGLDQEVAITNDGRDALDFLYRAGRHAERPVGFPQLILTDLNMPRMNGLELLKAIKHDETLAHIPVVIFTTSDAERDREACAALGAEDYLVKPGDFQDFVSLVGNLTSRWLQSDSLAM
ncbi:response regulator [Deinococcus peraridilitoris]|uniref:Response regulator with CheY-like receiver domain and winged-helix DNA-binding domain protein n=1 Tax=Deinococcus peraridilitoris (strain DSM 19664 / LMG 22246 / CIP 109416 / KR-200) TaxID=937777 RepID=L0A200_DEIPD|nr:response regulator [Deinococcus peraridilitoris]AFZ67035.1 response regulator with CheY-like receiver domain and winged-helix DNA-binding domain protein [Deinococcus peraridilitoris DSM 19664]